MSEQANNPLHGVKLADIVTFLRKTPWAREKVERLYLKTKK
ncbi:VF530 family DNA-binding protein [Leeuwenhoekiella sp. A16]